MQGKEYGGKVKSPFTIYCRLQRVAFVHCSDSEHATPHDNPVAATASAGTFPYTSMKWGRRRAWHSEYDRAAMAAAVP